MKEFCVQLYVLVLRFYQKRDPGFEKFMANATCAVLLVLGVVNVALILVIALGVDFPGRVVGRGEIVLTGFCAYITGSVVGWVLMRRSHRLNTSEGIENIYRAITARRKTEIGIVVMANIATFFACVTYIHHVRG